jgi:hypothetical protein
VCDFIGVLLRMLHDNPFLDGFAGVVFDEFHERGIEADLALGMVKLIRENVRPDLLAVVMSATIDPAPVAAYLGGAPVVESAGRAFPVEITYRPRRTDSPLPWATADAVRSMHSRHPTEMCSRSSRDCERSARRPTNSNRSRPSRGSPFSLCTATSRPNSRTGRSSDSTGGKSCWPRTWPKLR